MNTNSKKDKFEFSNLIPRPYLRVVKALGYALILGTPNAWLKLASVLMARLTVEERAALAFIALTALGRNEATMTVEAALGAGAGTPQAPLFGVMDQAAFWADMAEPEELDANCLACFEAMSRDRQVAFLEYVLGRQAS